MNNSVQSIENPGQVVSVVKMTNTDAFLKKMTKDTFYTIEPINWLLRGTALSNIRRKGLDLVESASIVKTLTYIIGFGLINTLCLYYKTKSFGGNTNSAIVRFSDSVQMTYWYSYLEYIIDLFIVLIFNRISYLKYLQAFDHIDSTLGMPCYDTIRKTIIKMTIFCASITFASILFDFIAWMLVENIRNSLIYSIEYLYTVLNIVTVLDIISNVIQVEYRLRLVAKLLQDYYNNDVVKPNIDKIIYVCDKSNTNKPFNYLKTLRRTSCLETVWFNRCYLQLLEQVAFINNTYGCRVLVYCVNLLFNMIYLLNLAIRIINGTMETLNPGRMGWLPSVTSTLRALNYGVIASVLMYRCEKTYRQSEKILEGIDLLLARKTHSVETKADLLEFRNLLITRPIRFHAAKFFTMNYTLLVSLSSVVASYTIIMLQNMA